MFLSCSPYMIPYFSLCYFSWCSVWLHFSSRDEHWFLSGFFLADNSIILFANYVSFHAIFFLVRTWSIIISKETKTQSEINFPLFSLWLFFFSTKSWMPCDFLMVSFPDGSSIRNWKILKSLSPIFHTSLVKARLLQILCTCTFTQCKGRSHIIRDILWLNLYP